MLWRYLHSSLVFYNFNNLVDLQISKHESLKSLKLSTHLRIWSWPSVAVRGLRCPPPKAWSAGRWSHTRCRDPGGRFCGWSCRRAEGRTWCRTQCGIPPPVRWSGRPRWCCWRSAESKGRWPRQLLAEAVRSVLAALRQMLKAQFKRVIITIFHWYNVTLYM